MSSYSYTYLNVNKSALGASILASNLPDFTNIFYNPDTGELIIYFDVNLTTNQVTTLDGLVIASIGATYDDSVYFTADNPIDLASFRIINLGTPINNSDGASKNYVDANFVNLTGSQTISGLKTFTTLPETSVTPTTNNQLTNKSYVDTVNSQATKTYNGNNTVVSNPKMYTARLSGSGSGVFTFTLPAGLFTNIFSVQATAEMNTTAATSVPLASIRSYTTSQVVVNVIQGRNVTLLGLTPTVEFDTNPLTVHLLVVGT